MANDKIRPKKYSETWNFMKEKVIKSDRVPTWDAPEYFSPFIKNGGEVGNPPWTRLPALQMIEYAIRNGFRISVTPEPHMCAWRIDIEDGTVGYCLILHEEELDQLGLDFRRELYAASSGGYVPNSWGWGQSDSFDETKFEGEDINNSPKEETIMGFGNKKRALPESIKDLDFMELRGDQTRLLADFLGVRKAVHRAYEASGVPGSRQALKDACTRDWDRAQQGYEVIVLGKTTAGMKKEMSESDVIKGLYSTVAEIINEHREEIGTIAVDKVNRAVDTMKKGLEIYAKDAIDRAAERKAPIIVKIGDKTKKIKGVLPPEFERMVQLASARIPIMLVGPAGCGKTYLCEKLAEALDMEYSDQSCSEGMSESVFNGLLLPIGKSGAFEHVSSPFIERYETGGVMLLDEIDAGDPNLFTYINKAIANAAYTVPQRWTKPVIKKHADFVLVAAANTFGHGADSMYVGRNQLDAATLDRFKVGLIQMDYNRDVELSLGSQELCEWAWSVRDKIKQNKLRRVMSTRVIQNLSKMSDRYKWQRKDWESTYFAGWSDADRRLVA